ncbi:hypothetical protein PACTADRAFT_955 [Pachysolen tannophilus NRRL Y-2460]|uniref:BHLH domain-containing protein n=1 Tax=Pachysolen tannophilus NRRL Y-2460 TaxID=669874 RepID=A0A1E4U3A3_PACTA|nr:hypothetical protein PACTADRAFT_955 [Pachysolen tannophilus NRRL Y-2460]
MDSNTYNTESFDFLDFDNISPTATNSRDSNNNNNNGGNVTGNVIGDQKYLEDLDSFGLTSGINIIDELSSPGTNPQVKQEQNYSIPLNDNNDRNLPQQAQAAQQQRGGNFSDLLNSQYFSPSSKGVSHGNLDTVDNNSNYPGSYNNLSFNNNQNLNNLISPGGFSDFDNSPYNSLQQDYLASPPFNSPSNFSPNLKANFSPSSPSSQHTHLHPKQHLSKEEKLRRRREFHNAVERRRRDLIKDRIKELGALIPPSLLFEIQFNKDGKEITKDTRANKALILNKTVEYIEHLQKISREQDERLAYLKQKLENPTSQII